MQLNYVIQDDRGNVGQNIPLVQGESRNLTLYWFNANGTPFIYTQTLTEALLKVFSNINQASVQKLFSASQITPITTSGGPQSGMIGFSFKLLAADTDEMAPNNNGLPATILLTGTDASELQIEFASIFTATQPLIQT